MTTTRLGDLLTEIDELAVRQIPNVGTALGGPPMTTNCLGDLLTEIDENGVLANIGT